MESNVYIRAWKGDELVHYREGHNIWIDTGREYLAKLIGDADDRRVRYMGFGIGSNRQSDIGVDIPPLSTSYPVGADTHATAGNEYNIAYPIAPLITTLERPVRVTGGSGDYSTPDLSNEWLAKPPPFGFYTARGGDTGTLSPLPPVIPVQDPPGPAAVLPTFPTGADTGRILFKARIDTNAGQLVYPPFTSIPLTEIGLFLSGSDTNEPFNLGWMVAYHSFATMPIVSGMVVEFCWTVAFT
jgi:hypothetical protein